MDEFDHVREQRQLGGTPDRGGMVSSGHDLAGSVTQTARPYQHEARAKQEN